MKKRVAVVGAGAAGMAAAYLLQQKFAVTLIEAGASLGGHAHSVVKKDSSGRDVELDVAFLVFNDRTYENFCRWQELLGVTGLSIEAEMSSCFSDPQSDLHYTMGRGLGPVFHQKRNLFRPRFWRMLTDLAAFRRRAYLDFVNGKDLSGITLGEYLRPYGRELRENFVLPLTSAIWSLEGGRILDFPTSSILRYFYNHQLLHGKSEKRWRTFRGSSGAYVRAFARAFSGKVLVNTPVLRIERGEERVEIHTPAGKETFDHVVLATHADLSLKLLAQPSELERKLLGAWRYQDNPVVLHQDTSVLHPDPAFWASWNMRRGPGGNYLISYWLNRVQSLSSRDPFLLTLGTPAVEERLVLDRFSFRHPIFTHESVSTQKDLLGLNGRSNTYYCGSYFGYGFHEDAIASAVEMAKAFGLGWPAN